MEIIKINAVWCPSCLASKKIWQEIEKDFPQIKYINLDYDLDEEEIKKYNVGTILPVVILKKDDIEVTRIIGEKSKKIIVEEINKIL